MPKQITYNKFIPFSQKCLVNEAKRHSFQEQLFGVSNTNQAYAGYCLGLSMKFLHSHNNNSTKTFMDNCVNFSHNTSSFSNNTILLHFPEHSRHRTNINQYLSTIKEEMAKVQTKKLLKQAMKIQDFHCKSNFILNLNSNYLKTSQSSGKNKYSVEEFKQLVYEALEKTYSDTISSNEYYINYKPTVEYATIKTNMDKFFSNLANNKTLDDNFNNHMDCLIRKIDLPKELFLEKDINLFINSVIDYTFSCQTLGWQKVNKKNHVDAGENIHYSNDRKIQVELSHFLSLIKNNDEKIQSYIFYSTNHACAVGIKNNQNGKEIYTLFDPNKGLYEFGSFKQFKENLTLFVNTHAEPYKFKKNSSNSDFLIKYTKVNGLPNESSIISEKERKLKLLVQNEVLALDEFNVVRINHDIFRSDRIFHSHFNKKNGLITLENTYYTDKQGTMHNYYIYSNQLDSEQLHKHIKNKYHEIVNLNSSIFIGQAGNIYQLRDNHSMNDFTQQSNIAEMFGSPTISASLIQDDIATVQHEKLTTALPLSVKIQSILTFFSSKLPSVKNRFKIHKS